MEVHYRSENQLKIYFLFNFLYAYQDRAENKRLIILTEQESYLFLPH